MNLDEILEKYAQFLKEQKHPTSLTEEKTNIITESYNRVTNNNSKQEQS